MTLKPVEALKDFGRMSVVQSPVLTSYLQKQNRAVGFEVRISSIFVVLVRRHRDLVPGLRADCQKKT